MKYSGIGGQAVMEGVMMKNKDKYAVAVRKPDKEIEIKVEDSKSIIKNEKIRNIPLLRGVFAFIDSLVLGMGTLTYSAEFYMDDEELQPSKFEKFLNDKFGEKANSIIMGFTVCISVIFAVALFVLLPYYVSRILKGVIESESILALIEGVIRVAIFILYIKLITLMDDIKRLFMYHGAEHKCINCIEHGLELNVANVKQSSKQHKRCGTSFLLIIMVISILVFMFIRFNSPVLRVVSRLLLVPVIAGISYEFLKLAGKSDNAVVNVLSKPGLWLQKLTTAEPDDDMIEVGIASVEAVFDWKQYLQENFGESNEQS